MKWSLRIGSIAGIGLYLHFTFLILIAWLIGTHYLAGHSLAAAAAGISFTLLLFAIIILHELGHALAAKRYGIKTKHITLLPIGGVAHLEKIPEDPLQELVVAVAGPAVNVVLGVILLFIHQMWGGGSSISTVSLTTGDLIARLFWLNLWIAGFNLLPAFPMDGGRVLRALLAMRMDRSKATDLAARIGQTMAIAFGFVGLFTHPFLLFIAFFVWIGAEGEAAHVRMKTGLADAKVRDVMARNFHTLESSETLLIAAHKMIPGFQQVFPVLENEKFVGFIGTEGIAKALAEVGPNVAIEHYVDRAIVSATPDELLSNVISRWEDAGAPALAVLVGGILVGIVTSANIGEHLVIHSALKGPHPTIAEPRLSLRRYP